GLAFTFIVPGLSGAITGIANELPATASTRMHAIALGFMSQAGPIASSIGDIGKRAADSAVRAALSQTPRDFLNALLQGFGVGKDRIVSHVTANIENRATLSDINLWLYVANWDPSGRSIPEYVSHIRAQYERWRAQVAPIGPLREGRRSTIEQDRPYATQVGVVWVQAAGTTVLVQAVVSNGRLSFSRFIDSDMRDMALGRASATQPSGVQTIPGDEEHIAGMPSSIPRSAARH
ncbi:MAG: hypothetical protein ACYC6L_16055, partial [Anaerolineae bacterium]